MGKPRQILTIHLVVLAVEQEYHGSPFDEIKAS